METQKWPIKKINSQIDHSPNPSKRLHITPTPFSAIASNAPSMLVSEWGQLELLGGSYLLKIKLKKSNHSCEPELYR